MATRRKKPGRPPKHGENAFDSAKLKTLREAAGLSQEQLAEAVGAKFQLISRYERGVSEPGFTTAAKLAAALGVTLDALKK